MIYRAMCYSPDYEGVAEQIVYINGGAREEVRERLQTVLAVIWGVPKESIDYYNLADERELIEQSTGIPLDGDARLFEISWHGMKAGYPDADTPPLFLLRPRDYTRMQKAWAALQDPQEAAKLRELLAEARNHVANPAEGHDDGMLALDLIERIDAILGTPQ